MLSQMVCSKDLVIETNRTGASLTNISADSDVGHSYRRKVLCLYMPNMELSDLKTTKPPYKGK